MPAPSSPVLAFAALVASSLAGSCLAQDLTASCMERNKPDPVTLALLQEVNLLRAHPRDYSRFVEEKFSRMDAEGFYQSEGKNYATTEGRHAVNEALAFLKSARPVPPLALSTCLSNAAQGHVTDQGPEGKTGHYGSDGSAPSERAERHLIGKAYCGENISYGMSTPRDVVIQLLVDDGVPTRGHRENLFKDEYKTVGFGFGPHKKFGFVAVELMCLNAIR